MRATRLFYAATPTERKHLPTQDVMAAGSWRGDARSLQTAYQHTNEQTVLAVVTEPRKRRDSKQAGGVQASS